MSTPMPSALAINEPDESQVQRYLDPAAPNFWCSVPLDTDEGKMLTFMAREGRTEQAGNMVGKEILVKNILLHPVSITRKDGEVVDLIRAVLIAPDTTMIATCSSGILSSLRTACQVFGLPPWTVPLRFRVVMIKIGEKNLFKLEPVIVNANMVVKTPKS